MKTRRVVVLLACLLCWSNYTMRAQAPSKKTAPAQLCWQEGERLTWADFRAKQCYDEHGKPCRYARVVGANTWAFVPVVGFVDDQGRENYRVACIFRRDSSWVNPRVTTPAERASALAHEQIHFDLAELTARKVRRSIARHRAAGDALFDPAVGQDIQCLLDDMHALNELYHWDVNFRPPGVEAVEQRRWEQRVARELRALAAYKSTAATCP